MRVADSQKCEGEKKDVANAVKVVVVDWKSSHDKITLFKAGEVELFH